MDLATKVHSNQVDIIITGTIKTVANAQAIKEIIQKTHMQHPDVSMHLIIKDSFIITSAVIGFLIKSIKMDKMDLHVNVESEELYDMLEDMNLIALMNVRKGISCEKA